MILGYQESTFLGELNGCLKNCPNDIFKVGHIFVVFCKTIFCQEVDISLTGSEIFKRVNDSFVYQSIRFENSQNSEL